MPVIFARRDLAALVNTLLVMHTVKHQFRGLPFKNQWRAGIGMHQGFRWQIQRFNRWPLLAFCPWQIPGNIVKNRMLENVPVDVLTLRRNENALWFEWCFHVWVLCNRSDSNNVGPIS